MSRPEPVTILDYQEDVDYVRIIARETDFGERWVDLESFEDGATTYVCLDLEGMDQIIAALQEARDYLAEEGPDRKGGPRLSAVELGD